MFAITHKRAGDYNENGEQNIYTVNNQTELPVKGFWVVYEVECKFRLQSIR